MQKAYIKLLIDLLLNTKRFILIFISKDIDFKILTFKNKKTYSFII